MQKSGTHLIINTLSNYLNNHFKINKKEKLSDLYKYFIVSIYDQKNETVINQKHYYKHIDIYETDISFFSGKKIFSYRNPFDQIVSHVSMNKKENLTSASLNQLYKSFAHRYARVFLNLRVCSQAKNSVVLSYESLIKKPRKEFEKIIDFLYGITDINSLGYALEESHINKFKEYEKHGFKTIKHHNVNHINNGKVGYWKHILTAKQIKEITLILDAYGIDMNQFEFE